MRESKRQNPQNLPTRTKHKTFHKTLRKTTFEAFPTETFLSKTFPPERFPPERFSPPSPTLINKITKISSLKNSFEFDIVFKSGTYFHKHFLTINAMKGSDFRQKLQGNKRYLRQYSQSKGRFMHIDSEILLGFSINKKVAKACGRNLIKRRLKAIVRDLVRERKLCDMCLIFVCRKEILELDFKVLREHIAFSIKKLNAILDSKTQNHKHISKINR